MGKLEERKTKKIGVPSNNDRTGNPEMFYKKGVLKHFWKNYRKKTCAGESFLIKFQTCSDIGIFLSILQKF